LLFKLIENKLSVIKKKKDWRVSSMNSYKKRDGGGKRIYVVKFQDLEFSVAWP